MAAALREVAEDATAQTLRLPRDAAEKVAEIGLRNLLRRGLLRKIDAGVEVVPEERPILAYYANSIVQTLSEDGAPRTGFKISARAKS